MKFRIEMHHPGVVEEQIEDEVRRNLKGSLLTGEKLEKTKAELRDKFYLLADLWFIGGEDLILEMDLETKTIKVLPT